MEGTITKQLPGQKTELPQSIINDLRKLDPKKFNNYVPFFGGHPLSLSKKDTNEIFADNKKSYSPYLICQKTDGVRYLLIITNSDHYFVSRQGKKDLVAYRSICKTTKTWHKNPWGQFQQIIHILDGQMINDQTAKGQEILRYLIFDALVIFAKKIIQRPLKERLDQCEKFIRCNQYLLSISPPDYFAQNAIQIMMKDFFRLSCNTYLSSQVMRQKHVTSQPSTVEFIQNYYIKALPHDNDGLIFNNEQKIYLMGTNQGYLKWKPAQLNTVDFLIVCNTNFEDNLRNRILDLYLGWRDTQMVGIYRVIFAGFTIVDPVKFQQIQRERDQKFDRIYSQNQAIADQDSFGVIAECMYDKVQFGSEESKIFRELLSPSKSAQQIRLKLMKQQNQSKQIQVIKKLQNQACTKYWRIYKTRQDKNMPNDDSVFLKIQQSIKDDIKIDQLIKKNNQLVQLLRVTK